MKSGDYLLWLTIFAVIAGLYAIGEYGGWHWAAFWTISLLAWLGYETLKSAKRSAQERREDEAFSRKLDRQQKRHQRTRRFRRYGGAEHKHTIKKPGYLGIFERDAHDRALALRLDRARS